MEYQIGDVTLQFHTENGFATVDGVSGEVLQLRIPEYLADMPVVTVGKKAFWGMEELREIYLPKTICSVSDWAFASCKQLQMICVPHKKIEIGRGAFQGCDKLREIRVRDENYEKEQPGLGYLIMAGDRLLNSGYLVDLEEAGSAVWYEKWDARMDVILKTPDDEDYQKILLCGVEDYGSRENTLEYCVEMSKKRKSRIVLLRLRYDYLLSKERRKHLQDFLHAHTKGQAGEEAWQVLLGEYADQKDYYVMYVDEGGVTEENLEECIADLKDEHTEMKAYLLRKFSGQDKKSFYDELEL